MTEVVRPPGAERPDAELVARAKAGDFEAFDALVTRHERRAYAIALRILRQREDAEDAVQSAFLKALEALEGFREEASFKTWITRIVVNTALKIRRKRGGLGTVSLDAAIDADEEGRIPHPEIIAEWRDDPHRLAEDRELGRIIEQAVEGLSETHRLVFLLREVERYSTRETAEALGISEANVKVRLLRARLALREKLTAAFGDPSRTLPHPEHREEGFTDAATLLRSYETR
jgi:RNA polymerase sigma-70 factor (ECF subfamily)